MTYMYVTHLQSARYSSGNSCVYSDLIVPLMRVTVWQGRVQKMVFSIGVAKGLIQVLK